MDALVGGQTNRHLRTAFLETGPEVIDYLMARTDVQFVPCGRHPDYHSNRPGAAVSGRAVAPRMFDGRLLGRDFERVRPPIPEFMVLGGMMVGKDDIPRLLGRFASVANLAYSARLFLRYLTRPLEPFAGHPRGDGQRAGRAALPQPAEGPCAGAVRRAASPI